MGPKYGTHIFTKGVCISKTVGTMKEEDFSNSKCLAVIV